MVPLLLLLLFRVSVANVVVPQVRTNADRPQGGGAGAVAPPPS